MENLVRTGFERRILRKMANRHSYHKEMSYRQLFQRTEIVREKVYLRTKVYRSKVDSNSKFQLLHRYFFSKVF